MWKELCLSEHSFGDTETVASISVFHLHVTENHHNAIRTQKENNELNMISRSQNTSGLIMFY